MTTPDTEIGAITTTTLRIMGAKLDEAAAIARAAEGCAVDGQPGRAPVRGHAMTTPNPEITAVTLRAMRAKLEEAAAIAGAAEGCAVDGQASRALTIALDVEPLAIEADQLLQGLAVLSRVAREEQDETEGLRCLVMAWSSLPGWAGRLGGRGSPGE